MIIPKRLGDLERLCQIAYQASPLAAGKIEGRTDRARMADKLFARIVLNATSIVRLLRTDSCIPEVPRLVDVSSVAALTRNLSEGYDVLYHVAIEKPNSEEEDFRNWLYVLHQLTEYRKICDQFGVPETEEFGDWDFMRQFMKMQLQKNPIFSSLDLKQQKELLRGKRPFYNPTLSGPKSQYVDPRLASGLYKLMSNHVHSHPLAAHMVVLYERANGIDSQGLLDMCIDSSAQHLALATSDYVRVRRRGKLIMPADKRYVHKQLALGPTIPARRRVVAGN